MNILYKKQEKIKKKLKKVFSFSQKSGIVLLDEIKNFVLEQRCSQNDLRAPFSFVEGSCLYEKRTSDCY